MGEPIVTAKVDIGENPNGVGFAIAVNMDIEVPSLDKDSASALVGKAHEVCPYSNAIRGNVDVTLNVV